MLCLLADSCELENVCTQLSIFIESSNNNNFQQQICTTCKKNKSISLTLLSKDEIYRMSIEGKRGLDA
jgi:hypothetical protein